MFRRSTRIALVLAAFGFASLGALHAAAASPADVSVLGGAGLVIPRGDGVGASTELWVEGPAADSTMTVTVPAAPAVTVKSVKANIVPASQVPIACSSGPLAHTYTCHTGSLTNNVFMVQVIAPANAPIGSTGEIKIEVDPVPGPDPAPSNNSAIVPFTVAGHVILHHSVSPLPMRVPVGGRATFHAVISNSGPDAATDVGAQFSLYSKPERLHYGTFTNSKVTVLSSRTAEWRVGTLGAGKQVTLDLPIRSTGVITEGNLTFDTGYYGFQIDFDPSGRVAYPITTTTAPKPAPAQPGGQGPGLATTGVRDEALVWTGAMAVAVGLVLWAGTRARRAR